MAQQLQKSPAAATAPSAPSVATAPKPPADPHHAQRFWLLEARHKDVRVRLVDGECLEGELVEVEGRLIKWATRPAG